MTNQKYNDTPDTGQAVASQLTTQVELTHFFSARMIGLCFALGVLMPILFTAIAQASPNYQAQGEAKMGQITFALGVDDAQQPVDPNFSFPFGVTEIHAVFDYENLAREHIWTQVWYHNGQEVVRGRQPWLADNTGTHDYLVQAGGQPIPAGQWTLEFYINDQLLSASSFIIEEAIQTSDSTLVATEPITPLKVYRLAYTKWNGEKHNLYIGDTQGLHEQFIMSRVAGPSWSPDGRHLFFYGEEGVDQQIVDGHTHRFDGVTNGLAQLKIYPIPQSVTQLRFNQGYGWNDGTARVANVSPDGSMIAYDGDRGGGRRIYFLGTDANQQFHIEIIGEQADWSPDSTQIVFRSGRNNQTGLWISNRDGTGSYRLTEGGNDSFPTWSPDGESVSFSRESGGNVDIYRVNIDGTGLTRLTTAPGHDTLPTYIPNGDIIFRSARNGRWEIWQMTGEGEDQTVVIADAPVGPDWSYSRMSVLP